MLSGFDASFLAAETAETPMHTLTVLTLRVPPGERNVRAFATRALARAAHALPALRARPRARRWGHPVWEEVPVDLDAHVSAETLWPTGRRTVEDALGELIEPLLPRDRPLWAARILERPGSDEVTIGLKYHHALGDALASVRSLAILSGHGEPSVGTPPLARSSVRGALAWVGELASLLVATLLGLVRSARHAQPIPFSTRNEAYDGPIGARRHIGRATLRFEAIAAARRGTDATVNDVLLTLVARALRRLDPVRRFDGPLIAAQPVAVGEGGHDRGNHLSSMLVPVHVEAGDAQSCLRATAASTRAAKSAHHARGVDLVMRWSELAPAWALRLTWALIRRLPRPPAHLVVSNIPGPKGALMLGDAALTSVSTVGPLLTTTGLNVTFESYAGGVHVLVASAGGIDPRALAHALADAADELAHDDREATRPSLAA
ncbi:MAG: wax ester/triacylglycerol synthase domain-containing protein [Sandaracinaceae bacterium]